MAFNAIRDVTFRPVAPDDETASEGAHALFLTLALGDPTHLADFFAEVVARFTREVVAGPPNTRFMLILVDGDVPASELADTWRAAIAHDAPARALLGTLQQADVMQRDPQGRMIASVTLLGAQPIEA